MEQGSGLWPKKCKTLVEGEIVEITLYILSMKWILWTLAADPDG